LENRRRGPISLDGLKDAKTYLSTEENFPEAQVRFPR
jgi:hypothetical protein